MTRKMKHALFAAIPSVIAVLFLLGFLSWYKEFNTPVARGKSLNQKAWELSYVERGLPVPPSGPREGYWGSRLGTKVRDPVLGWHEPPVSVPDLIAIDKDGIQRYSTASAEKHKVLILGGSVAWGAYASRMASTYFHVIGAALERQALFSDIEVFASGAWKSRQEVRALEVYGKGVRPDLVVFLDGLNDLTNGATSRALFGQRTATADGSEWTTSYHAHDYEQRVVDYLRNMRVAARMAAALNSDLLVVLQPALFEKKNKSKIEAVLLEYSLKPHASEAALAGSYESMRRGLSELARDAGVHFLDCSRVLADERPTTFSDMWHFSDAGHQLLGSAVAGEIASILKQRQDNGQRQSRGISTRAPSTWDRTGDRGDGGGSCTSRDSRGQARACSAVPARP